MNESCPFDNPLFTFARRAMPTVLSLALIFLNGSTYAHFDDGFLENLASNNEPTAPEDDPRFKLKVGEKDWPQWGGSANRNNVPSNGEIPLEWDVKKGTNVRWSMKLGTDTFGGVVVANRKVFVGTNNSSAYLQRFPSTVDLSVLLCFDELDGKFLWQHSNSKLSAGRAHDWPNVGICSTPLVDGERLWYVTNRGQVVCLDTLGFRDGENDGPFNQEDAKEENEADVVWVFDMMKELNVSQLYQANCSVTCAGKFLFVNTSQGVGPTLVHSPKEYGPSFICLNRTTGQLVWADNSPSENILHGQWSSPAFGVIGGVPQVIFGGGDGYVYGFLAQGEANKPKLLWKFDCNVKGSKHKVNHSDRYYPMATPVIHNGLVYIGIGQDPQNGISFAGNVWCIDPTKRGDVSPTLVYNERSPAKAIAHKRELPLDASDGDFEKPNPNSAEVWRSAAQGMDCTISTVAIHNDLLFAPDFSGKLHCLNVKSGEEFWVYDMQSACWSSPLIVDDRVYICDEDGDVAVLQLSDKMQLLKEYNLGAAIYSTPIVANNSLFIASRNQVFAIQDRAKFKSTK